MKISFLAIVFGLFVVENLSAADIYSDGYRMGQLIKCSIKGYRVKSLECQLLLGVGSSQLQGEGVSNSALWDFSGDPSQYEEMVRYIGRTVWVHYNESPAPSSGGFFSAPLRDTDYLIKEIGPISMEVSGKSELTANANVPEDNVYSKGIRFGRIVKSSNKGSYVKTWELLIQLGDSGNTLKPMSLNDSALFLFSVNAVKSGKRLIIHYTQEKSKSSWNDSEYIIDGIKYFDAER